MSGSRLLPVEDFDAAPPPPPIAKAVGCDCPRCAGGTLPLCRGAAWDEGHRAGREERVAVDARQLAGLEAALREALGSADAQIADMAEATAEALGRAVIALVAATLPASCAALGPREAQRVAEAVLPGLHGEAEVTVTAAPEAAALLANVVGPDGGRVHVVGDASAGPGDVRVTWQAGRAVRDAAQTLARVREVLDAFGLMPAPGGMPAPELRSGGPAPRQDIGEPAHG